MLRLPLSVVRATWIPDPVRNDNTIEVKMESPGPGTRVSRIATAMNSPSRLPQCAVARNTFVVRVIFLPHTWRLP